MSKTAKKGPFPSFFRASILESRAAREGYAHAGCVLAFHVRNELSYEIEDAEEAVDAALKADEPAEAVWKLIEAHMPRCAAVVPRRRRRTFLQGIEAAIEQERV